MRLYGSLFFIFFREFIEGSRVNAARIVQRKDASIKLVIDSGAVAIRVKKVNPRLTDHRLLEGSEINRSQMLFTIPRGENELFGFLINNEA